MSDIDMPSAREHGLLDLRRKRAGIVAGVVLFASVIGLFASREMGLAALPVVALLAYLSLPSWVGVEPRFPVPTVWVALRDHMLSFGVPMVGVMLMYLMLNKGELAFAIMIPLAAVGAVIYGAYRWRYSQASMVRLRGGDEAMPLLSRLWRHYLGYAAGLAAGTAAAFAGDTIDWAIAATGFVGAFLVAKAAVDLSLPQPPIESRRLSIVLAQLAIMSPIWFGLPWGAAMVAAMSFGLRARFPLTMALQDNAIVVVYAAISAIVVFTALALIAFVIEVATGEG